MNSNNNNKVKLGLLALLMGLGSIATAQAGEDVVLSEKEVTLNVDISTAKTKLSIADYSSPVVKVLVPELADVTILDHRNTGEGAPCLATYDTLDPRDVIQGNPTTEKINFKVTLIKQTATNTSQDICYVRLSERVEGNIRGFKFTHNKQKPMGTRHIDDCR